MRIRDVMYGYLAEQPRIDIIGDFLRHEAKKPNGPIYKADLRVMSSRTSDCHMRLIEALRASYSPETGVASIDSFVAQLTLKQKWALFHVVSCGGLEKDLFNCVGCPSLSWALKNVPLRQTQFETRVGPLRGTSLSCRPTFMEVVSFLGRNPDDQDPDPHGHGDPLIGRKWDGENVLVHDGNGRLLSYAFKVRRNEITDAEGISVWVGCTNQASEVDNAIYSEACGTIFLKRMHSQ